MSRSEQILEDLHEDAPVIRLGNVPLAGEDRQSLLQAPHLDDEKKGMPGEKGRDARMKSSTSAGKPFRRYEYLKDDKWLGIFSLLDPSERRFINKYLKAPAWYGKNPDADSQAWFTDRGFNRYHKLIEQVLERHRENWLGLPPIRIREAQRLENVVSHGSVQCIVLLGQSETEREDKA